MPKKRGPKTDVLEALLKRVDGLEAKLKEKKDQPSTPSSDKTATATAVSTIAAGPSCTVITEKKPSASVESSSGDTIEVKQQPLRPALDTARAIEVPESAVYTPSPSRCVDVPSEFKGSNEP